MVDAKAAGINGAYLLFAFFIWVACLDAFGGELHYVTFSSTTFSYYQDRISGGGAVLKYSAAGCSAKECNACQSGGGGIVAMMFFAWFCAWGSLILGGFRAAGKEAMIPKLNLDAEKCIKIEFYLMIAETLLFFFGIIAWGTCYSAVNNDLPSGATIGASGFGFIIFVFLLQLGFCPLLWWMTKHPEVHRIAGGTSAPGGAKTNDNPAQPPASSSGQQQNAGVIDATPAQPQTYEAQPQGANDLPR